MNRWICLYSQNWLLDSIYEARFHVCGDYLITSSQSENLDSAKNLEF